MEKHVKTKRHLVIGLVILGMLSTLEAKATVFISDHFDDQETINMGPGNDPPPPWGNAGFHTSDMDITPDASHNAGGKGFRISWPTGQTENALCVPNGDVTSWPSEIYVGYWHHHKAPWDHGTSARHKWLHFFVGGESAIWNYDHGRSIGLFFDGARRFNSNIRWDDNDGAWHKFVFRMKLGTGTDAQIQVWRDGVELVITEDPTYGVGPPTGFNFGGTSFEQRMCFGFQHHAGLGTGMWEDWDDIIVASTHQEVLDFLGGGTPPPPPPTNSAELTSLSVNGPSSVNENGTASYTAAAFFSDSTSQTVTAATSWNENSAFATISLGLLSTSSVTSTQSVSIAASYTYNGITKTGNKQVTIQDTDDPPAGGVTLLEETFDNAGLDQREWYDAGSTNSSVVFDADRQNNVLESVYSTGSTTPNSGALRHLFTETETIYVRYFVKYSSNWQWTGKSFGPHEWYLLTNANHQWKGPARSRLTFYIEANQGTPLTAIQDGENIDTQNIGVDLTGVTEDRAVAGCNGNTDGYPDGCYESGDLWFNGKQLRATNSAFQNNNWHRVEVYVKMNSINNGIGQTDGVIQYWLDGDLVLNLNQVLIRTGAQPTLKFNQILFGPYFGPGVPNQQSFRIDDLLVRDSVPNSAGGDTTPPSAPTGLYFE